MQIIANLILRLVHELPRISEREHVTITADDVQAVTFQRAECPGAFIAHVDLKSYVDFYVDPERPALGTSSFDKFVLKFEYVRDYLDEQGNPCFVVHVL